jgi:enoyl-CoA hydratase
MRRTFIECESRHELVTARRALNRSESFVKQFERRVFHSLFATEDQKEGMNAFVEKRKAKFLNR